MIKKVDIHDDFEQLARLLNESFLTVAKDFGLTKKNCPTNSAFISAERLRKELIPQREFYCLIDEKHPIGFIAIEKSEKEPYTFYLEKVAVHPNYRHQQKGQELVNFAENRIAELGGKRVSIALINEHVVLKNWYKSLGYTETSTKVFERLPFTVCFMDKNVEA